MGVDRGGRARAYRATCAVLLLALTACSGVGAGAPVPPPPSVSGAAPGPSQPQNPASPGGELQVLNARDFEYLDPQRNYSVNAGNAGRLLTRTLTMVAEQAGQQPRLAGDLARSWTSADGNRRWTFRLKPGLRYEDGTAVTARDVKYGVERSFAPELAEGAPYARRYLAGADTYRGPYRRGNNGGRGLASVAVSGADTITFTLNQPVADFPWVTSTFTFSPVPAARDTRDAYDDRPLSTGPYRIERYERGRRLVLVRNPHWNRTSDGYRTALPERFDFLLGQDATTISRRLLAGGGETDGAMTQDAEVQDEDVAELERPELAGRIVEGPSLCVRYLALNTRKAPITSARVRIAVSLAVDRAEVQRVRGGPRKAEVASGLIPRGMLGYRERTAGSAGPVDGDPARARRILAEAGLVGPKVVIATGDQGRAPATGEAVAASLREAGFETEVRSAPDEGSYTGQHPRAPDAVLTAWCADWPSPGALIPPVLGPETFAQPGGRPSAANLSSYDNPVDWTEIRRIAQDLTEPRRAAAAWAALHARIAPRAPVVPLVQDRGAYVVGARVFAAETTPTFGGQVDLVKVGVRS